MRNYPGLLVLLLLSLPACRPSPTAPADSQAPQPPAGPTWFEDITVQSGVQFVHEAGPTDKYFMPSQMGSGGALFDYDTDGRLDIYLIQHGGPGSKASNRLFHQETNGVFRDTSEGSGLNITGFGMGAATGDVNNDGFPDLLVTEYGATRLFLNQGGKQFLDVTAGSGVDNPRWATSAAFFDYDRDGWLDLVVANYLDYDPSQQCFDAKGAPEFCGPHGFPGLVTRLYHHRGSTNSPLFEDVTVRSGLVRHPGPALGVVCADFNGDRWPDIFLADDGKPNRLFMNRTNGTFAEEAILRGVAYNVMGQTAGNMGIALGDVDNNGLFDFFVTHLAEELHTIWKQEPRGLFQDRTAGTGLSRTAWQGTGFGAVLADFDHNGALDLAFVNGLVKRTTLPSNVPAEGTTPFWSVYAQRHQLFSNDGTGRFQELSRSAEGFTSRATVGRGLACGDLDNDGALDLLVTSTGGRAQLFRNVVPQRGHWLSLRVVDPSVGGRDAYGAEVTVRSGDRRWWRLVSTAYSYLSAHDPRVHVGLGAVTSVESMEVIWPDGSAEQFPGGAVDQLIVLRKGAGRR